MPDDQTFPIQANLFELSITGLVQRIEQIFGFNCSFILGGYDRRAEAKVDGEIKYPYSNLRLNGVERRDQSGPNRTASKKYGQIVRLEESGQYWFKFYGSPLTATFALRMVFGDQQDLFRAIHNYFIKENHFSFVLESPDSGFQIVHNVQQETQISIPEYEESEYGINLPFETSLRLSTWTGLIHRIPIIKTVQGSVYPDDKDIIENSQNVIAPEFFSISNLSVCPISEG